MGALTTAAAAAYAGKKIDKALNEPIKRISGHFCDVCKEKKLLFSIKKELKSEDFLRDYIINSYNEIGRAKTLLYRDESRLIEEFCINTDLSYEDNQGETKTITTDKVQNILDHSHKTIITGLGGMGKTIMMKFIHINCIKQLDLVPVFITLRNVPVTDDKANIFDYVKELLTRYGAKMSDELIEASLQKGCYLILFDGFDEVKSNYSDTISQEIQKFSSKYNNNVFIVSSRPSDSFIGWQSFKELHTKPLNLVQTKAIIDKIQCDNEKRENFKNELETKLFKAHESFASNPLLLTIMFFVYRSNGYIPDDFCDFYAKAFSVMFYEHDSIKNHKREIHSKLNESQLESLFAHFFFKTFFRQKYSFKENELIEYIKDSIKKTNNVAEPLDVLKDLSENLCMLVKEGLEYKFVHRSFQEYFAAIYTKLLSDEDQKKLLSAFLAKRSSLNFSEYFPILVNRDGERFYKNIIVEMLDEIEATYNSVGQDDYEFLLNILNNYKYGQNGKTAAIIIPINYITYEKLFFLMRLYTAKNIKYDLTTQLLFLGTVKDEYYEKGTEILNENGSEYHAGNGEIYRVLNAAEFINILCAQTDEKEEITEYFQPTLDEIKSWFQNRLYQESCIYDLLNDM